MAPTLPDVLSIDDIRDRIFTPLLTISDKIYVERWSKNFPGINLLHVNVEIRKASWKFLMRENIWLGVRFVWNASDTVQSLPSAILHTMNHMKHPQPTLVQANFIPELFSPEMIREFHSSVAVTISIGHAQGKPQPVDHAEHEVLPVFFAFHPRKYELFIRDLADTVEQWRCMTVEANHAHIYKFPDMIPVVVDQIIRGLDHVRDAERVTSTSLCKDSIDLAVDFKAIAWNMMSPNIPEIHAKLLDLYTLGIKSMDKGDYRKAYSTFARAHGAYETYYENPEAKPKFGSIAHNMIEDINTDILSMVAEAMNQETSARRNMSTDGHAGPRLLVRETEAVDLNRAVAAAEIALSCPGITDHQRFHAHYRRAIALANMGDFVTELCTVIPQSERAKILAQTQHVWRDASRCYKCASRDAFFANNVAGGEGVNVSQELMDATNALRTRMCAKVGQDANGHLAQMKRSGLTRVILPGLGLWEGDPMLCSEWGAQRMMLLALFRMRNNSSGANPADLRDEFVKHGLGWAHDKRGQVYLDGTTEARMSPIWVMPDDTRDGLRDAGLSGEKFEMARR